MTLALGIGIGFVLGASALMTLALCNAAKRGELEAVGNG